MAPILSIDRRSSCGEYGEHGGKYKRGELARLPDESGTYQVEVNGKMVNFEVEMHPQESTVGRPAVAITSDFFKGHLRRPGGGYQSYYGGLRRVVFVDENGRGSQSISSCDALKVERSGFVK